MYLYIITLNENGLNTPIKISRVAKWIKKQDLCICSLYESHFRSKDTNSLELKRWNKMFFFKNTEKCEG